MTSDAEKLDTVRKDGTRNAYVAIRASRQIPSGHVAAHISVRLSESTAVRVCWSEGRGEGEPLLLRSPHFTAIRYVTREE